MTTGAPALEPCPWCNKPLFRGRSAINPYAVCKTEGCFGARMPVVNLDDPSNVAAWNLRASGTEAALEKAATRIIELNDSAELGRLCDSVEVEEYELHGNAVQSSALEQAIIDLAAALSPHAKE